MRTHALSRREFLKVAAAASGTLALGSMVGACAPTGAPIPPGAETTPTAIKEVTLRFWHQWGGSRTELLQQAITRFQDQNPAIKVMADLHGWDAWPTEQLTAIAGGDVPELVLGAPMFVPEFANSNALIPLTPYLRDEGIDLQNLLFPTEYELTQYGGETWILPMSTNGGSNILFYNKGMFEAAGLDPDQPPTTWAALEEATARLTRIEGGRVATNGFTILGSYQIVQDFKHWLITNDAEWISQDGKNVRFDQPNGLETLEWVVHFADSIYGGWQTVAVTGGSQEEAIWTALYNEREAMYVSGPWMFGLIRDNAPGVYANLGVGRRPRNKGNAVGGVVGDSVGIWMLRGNNHPDESWQALKYLTIGDGGCDFMKAQVRPSPVMACSADPIFQENNPWWDTVIEVLESEVPFPRTPVNARLDDLTQQMVEQALFKRMTPSDAIEWGAEQVQAVLDEYWATRG